MLRILWNLIRNSDCNHLTANNLIGSSQHDFINGRSCMTNLLEFLEAETNDFDRGESFNVIYLNFAKASD
jgi:hypothetical protein